LTREILKIDGIPAILWGDKSSRLYIYVHGKKSSKEGARGFAEKAAPKGYQVLSFDLPEHGERTGGGYPCVPWNGIHDLKTIGKYALENWGEIRLYAESLGAYFSLLAYSDLPLTKALFVSPILDMERLIQNMMQWFSATERELMEKREIPTPMGETLSWEYYCYARENPIRAWNVPTAILCGSGDTLTERELAEKFSKRFKCDLTVIDGGGHWLHTERERAFWGEWIEKYM